jgi:hypothetical protein
MVVYREKEIIFDCLKRSLDKRRSPVIYTFFNISGCCLATLKRRCFDSPYRVQDTWYLADLPNANLVDIRML